MSRIIVILTTLLIHCNLFGASPEITSIPVRFGHPLLGLDSTSNDTSASLERAALNIRHSGDLITKDIRYYQPEISSPGREITFSELGRGAAYSKVIWNGRVLRDTRTGRADMSLVNPASIGMVRRGSQSGGSSVILAPIRYRPAQPVTSLHHHEGFYGFLPVEFNHLRPVSRSSQLKLGGLFPNSTGRFPPHSGYSGQILSAAWVTSDNPVISVSFQDGLHKTASPYRDHGTKIHRTDFDASFQTSIPDLLPAGSRFSGSLFRTETFTKRERNEFYGREWGIGSSMALNSYLLSANAGKTSGTLPGGTDYDLDNLELGISTGRVIGDYEIEASLGYDGDLPDRMAPSAQIDVKAKSGRVQPFLSIELIPNPHSPEERFASYRSPRFEEPLQPLWEAHPTLPVKGSDLPLSSMRAAELGGSTRLFRGVLTVSGYFWDEANPAGWRLDGDTAIVWKEFPKRRALGWILDYQYMKEEWRGKISTIRLNRDFSADDQLLAEPPFRLYAEIGRHKSYFNGAFETDILFSGKYIAQFHSPAEIPGERLGGAYPLDARFTGRIGRFTFYYGLHNWNAYPYWLIPGYKMMHKEEYWGIDWLLLN